MGYAPSSWIEMKFLVFINFFLVALMFGQVPISKPPSFPPEELPDFNASDSNISAPQPPRRSSQVETIRTAEIDLRHGKEGERVGAAKLLGNIQGL